MTAFPEQMAAKFYQGCSPAAIQGCVTREEALAVARRYVAVQHPDAACAFVFGSAVCDTLGPCSDLDLLIVEHEPEWCGVRRLIFEGFPVEAHIFGRKGFLAGVRAAVTSGRVNVTFALAECETLMDATGLGADLHRLVTDMIAAGRPPMSREAANLSYCAIATSLIELSTNPSEEERFGTIIRLQSIMMDFYFDGRREWVKSRKWAVKDAPDFARRLHSALGAAWRSGDIEVLTDILDELSAPWPDLAWEGAHVRDRMP